MIRILSIVALLCATKASAQVERELSWGSHNGMFYSLISATNFVESTGAVETITTPDGIRAVGFLDPGDTLGYALDVPIAGMYSLVLHLASPDGEGLIEIANADKPEDVYARFEDLPSSNGNWEDYQTAAQNITLPQGQLVLQVSVLEAGFNLMWLSLEQLPEVAPVAPVEEPVPSEPATPADPATPAEPTEPAPPIDLEPQELTTAPTMAKTLAPTVAPTAKKTPSPTATPTMKKTPSPTVTPIMTEQSVYTEQCFSAGNYLAYQGCDILPRGVGFVGPLEASTIITYPFEVTVTGVYLLQLSVQGQGGLNVTCEATGKQYAYIESLPTYRTTSSTDVWYTVSSVMYLEVGKHHLQMEAVVGGWSMQSLCLLPVASHSVSCSVGAAR